VQITDLDAARLDAGVMRGRGRRENQSCLGISRLPVLPLRSTLASGRRGGAPLGVIHSLLPWSSGRAAWSGAQDRRRESRRPDSWPATNRYEWAESLRSCRGAALAELDRLAAADVDGNPRNLTGPHQDTKSTDSAVRRAIVSGVSATLARRSWASELRLVLTTYVGLIGC
jgi:hypothetical protein